MKHWHEIYISTELDTQRPLANQTGRSAGQWIPDNNKYNQMSFVHRLNFDGPRSLKRFQLSWLELVRIKEIYAVFVFFRMMTLYRNLQFGMRTAR